jgi:ribosomal protein S18 acetylase RimI-like enzyme
MVCDLPAASLHTAFPPGMTIRRVTDEQGLRDAVAASAQVFAPGPGWELRDYLPRLGDPTMAIFRAEVDGATVSAARLELPKDREFASLWGGGTRPEYRSRGVYRAMVAARAEVAGRLGYQYLTVDAMETSRPILEKVGFTALDSVVGWVLSP